MYVLIACCVVCVHEVAIKPLVVYNEHVDMLTVVQQCTYVCVCHCFPFDSQFAAVLSKVSLCALIFRHCNPSVVVESHG